MKTMILKLLMKMNHSSIIRTIISPLITVKRKIEEKNFSKSEDAAYIRELNNIKRGKSCFIIGNGPSLNGDDLDLITGFDSFACNRIYNIYSETRWRPTFYMCSDRQCLLDEINNIKKLQGSKKFLATWAKKYGRKPEDKLHYFLISDPFEPRVEKKIQRTVHEDVARSFSVTQTITCNEIEFAIYMGYKTIYLLGVDHNYPITIDKNGKKTIDNSVKSHFKGGGSKQNSLHYIYYDAATECYENIRKYADAHGIKIYNATRGGKLEAFQRIKLEDVVEV